MYKRVLVPLDGSELAEAVLPYIAELAGPLDLEMILFRAVVLTPAEAIHSRVAREQEAREYLAPLVSELRARGFRASSRVALGEPTGEVVAAARQAEADLIAMTTHGRSGLGRLLFGSVAEAVLREAPSPVFLLRMTEAALAALGPARKARLKTDRILFAADFSEAALAAWTSARRLARALAAELILEHVIPPLTVQGDLPVDIYSRYWEGAQAEAAQELAKLRAEADREGVKVRARVDEGRVADRIIAAVEEEQAGLIVVGTTGKTGFRRLLLGSVAAAVLRGAPCPVVVIGPAGQREKGSHGA